RVMNTDERQIGTPSQSSDTAARVRSLSPARAELVKLLEQKRKASDRQKFGGGRILPRPAQGAAPVSFAQQRLWLADQTGPSTPLYNEHAALCIRGRLEIEVLERCVNEVVRRHEVLRTSFIWKDAGLQTRCVGACEVAIPLVDLSHADETTRRK